MYVVIMTEDGERGMDMPFVPNIGHIVSISDPILPRYIGVVNGVRWEYGIIGVNPIIWGWIARLQTKRT